MKQALFIVYSFPPAGGPGVQRALKFIKYLPEWGWQPIVLTTTPEAYTVLDPSLAADIPPDTPIYRVRSYDVRALRPAFERVRLGKLVSAMNVALMAPDAARFWARASRSTLQQIMQAHQPRVIFSSSPPASAHLAAGWAQQTFGTPWVADFRDPWSQNPLHPYPPGYRNLNRRMESQLLARADAITTVSPPLVTMLARLSGRPDAVRLIENGYDEADVIRHSPPQTDRFTITYTGEFSPLRRPDAFVQAVNQLVESQRIPADAWTVQFAGKNPPDYIPERPPFRQLGYLSHQALNTLRKNSDVLLLIMSDDPAAKGNYSGKLFEYLASNRPILAVARPDNVAAQLIRQARAGTVVPHDADSIADAIEASYRAWQAGRFEHAPDWELIGSFSRRNLTGRLAALFDELQ